MKPEILHEGKFLRLIRNRGWEYAERHTCSGIVIIMAMTRDKKIILVEQFRLPVGKLVIEFPAGLVADITKEEKLETAALRELEEETGYRAKRMIPIMTGPASSGSSSDLLYLFRAVGVKKVSDGGGDSTEKIIVHEIPLSEADKWLQKQQQASKLVDPKVYAGIYFLSRH